MLSVARNLNGRLADTNPTQGALLPTLPPPTLQSYGFQWLNLLIIIANTGVMASVSYPMSPAWDHADNYLNLAFTCWFAAEMLVKLMGTGFKGYFRSGMNRWADGLRLGGVPGG